ncbi:hypothetical protein GLOIN_2v1641187 [Rhizophagus irregularis DAOM 181602=DAOM 197198]|uniref:Uncharacterized protein n=1 Tax=Rhizophagus irregularis (strain DAOM 181602 / DAOM 197198 / MUCL 43194) TaxID=747089 RepID=A0A2P4PRK5_RHIID|nr:hypothetical protein GLOIN_2v1641187 [Rhizophagus irregularis DAOM 181602=DAOM 197198]POG68012.1 hypothetical protein GLOIN_2v1641187 [Rhizophagus irregularis DAOM 181602=DAOM 197198]|eukprot:XP_025174878.1 hypothetical protein GLOIN_2v1641187 [Rhizophagus irregularis DAOM 181602=DAOM 197198]
MRHHQYESQFLQNTMVCLLWLHHSKLINHYNYNILYHRSQRKNLLSMVISMKELK